MPQVPGPIWKGRQPAGSSPAGWPALSGARLPGACPGLGGSSNVQPTQRWAPRAKAEACGDSVLLASLPPPCLPEKTLEARETGEMGSHGHDRLAQTQLSSMSLGLSNLLLRLGSRGGLSAGQAGNAQAGQRRVSLSPQLITATLAEPPAPQSVLCPHLATSPRGRGESPPHARQVGCQRPAADRLQQHHRAMNQSPNWNRPERNQRVGSGAQPSLCSHGSELVPLVPGERRRSLPDRLS